MQLIRGLHNLKHHQPCALTIGNFDGVHRGHQALLQRLVDTARQLQLPACVMSFEPLPQEYFSAQDAPPRLTRLREKWCALANTGIDQFLCIQFDHRLAALTAEEFIHKILVENLRIRYLLVGDDFRFGKGRTGDYAMLKQAGKEFGFEVADSHSICLDETRISSTAIRKALTSNQLAFAQAMLGRPYQICGRIAHGDKRGRTIGFPTANIKLRRHATPLSGVYAVSLHGLTDRPVYGVANIGKRPTVDGHNLQLEVHLFNFNQTVYGREVCVEFHHKLRDEQRFESFDALKQQIQIDSKQAQAFFA
ncbi:MAG TPA: bifunctional riboflavin kinase/FAD synthetase, partial [Gammaproteobacteria bacterium]|nr:bifunctional riboflavin kinase/FAD synthetase [Gammaproteobacteria bacterium]